MKTPASRYVEHGREVRFADVLVWTQFEYKGSTFIKRSPRTAAMHWPAGPDKVKFQADTLVLTLQGVE